MAKQPLPELGYIVRTGPSSWRVGVVSEHVCGLQGFNPMLGDNCPACDEGRKLWEKRYEAPMEHY